MLQLEGRRALVGAAIFVTAACAGSSAATPVGPEPTTSASATSIGTRAPVHAASPVGATAGHPCGFVTHAPRHYRHVLWIWLENHGYDQVVGHMSYLDSIGAKCGLATNYHSIRHPSLPNYIATTSGGTQGITNDCEPTSCPVRARSLFRQVQRAGLSWRGYAESMSGRCSRASYGQYAARHNPAVYYNDVHGSCARYDVPLNSRSHGLRHDLAAGLPSFAFVTPNLCNDAHDCSLTTADHWLATWLPRIFRSHAWKNGRTAVFVTFDEDEGPVCAAHSSSVHQCRVATWVFGPAVRPGTKVRTRLTHYSLLKTTEGMLGLAHLGHAKDRSTTGMRKPFHL